MPVPGSIVIQNVVRGFSLVHRGHALARRVLPPFRTREGGGRSNPLPILTPPLKVRGDRGVMI